MTSLIQSIGVRQREVRDITPSTPRLPGNSFSSDFVASTTLPASGHRRLLLSAQRINEGPEGDRGLILLAFRDVTGAQITS